MVKSNAQRQAEYRARHLKEEGGNSDRLNIVINLHAKRALERLAACYGVTQRSMLERLITEAERDAVDQVASLPNGQADYYDRRLRIGPEFVTR